MKAEVLELLKDLPRRDWWDRQKIIERLTAHHEKEYIAYLEQSIRDHDNADIRNTAMEVYRALGIRAFPSLATLLKEDDPEVRLFAVNIICQIGDRKGFELLVSAMRDKDENVRCASAEGLGRIGDSRALAELKRAFSDEPWVAMAAIGSVGEIGGKEACGLLYECLDEGVYREAAVLALEKAGDRHSIIHLTPFFSDRNLRGIVLRAIVRIAERERVKPQPEYFISLAPLLIETIRSSDDEMRKHAFMALCWAGDVTALPHLIDALREEDLQEYAIEGLLNVGRKAVCSIVDELKESSGGHRLILAKILTMMGEQKALLQFADDDDAEVRTEVALALGSIDMGRAVKALEKMCSDPYEEVRQAAAKSLRRCGKNGQD
jgi:HEAT repeat protein